MAHLYRTRQLERKPIVLSLGRAAKQFSLPSRHQELTGIIANWTGTYENAVHHWLRQQEKDYPWSR
jgi:hypothetical protein